MFVHECIAYTCIPLRIYVFPFKKKKRIERGRKCDFGSRRLAPTKVDTARLTRFWMADPDGLDTNELMHHFQLTRSVRASAMACVYNYYALIKVASLSDSLCSARSGVKE